jgi:hypothetical protein
MYTPTQTGQWLQVGLPLLGLRLALLLLLLLVVHLWLQRWRSVKLAAALLVASMLWHLLHHQKREEVGWQGQVHQVCHNPHYPHCHCHHCRCCRLQQRCLSVTVEVVVLVLLHTGRRSNRPVLWGGC